ncbi:MAG: orotidine-5'-phosphate decarboxylase [Ferruginibacter sp.]
MTKDELIQCIRDKKSYLCVGLDTDPGKLPAHLKDDKDAVLKFNTSIIEATKDYCCSYKINTAFYEAMGARGWEVMEETVKAIPATHLKIADAKRGDIGNTSSQYARAFFETLKFDAITVAPYMGEDSIRPFLDYRGKWTIVLGLTSNAGANDFEMKPSGEGKLLYERVLETVSKWGSPENLMFVAGSTQAGALQNVRKYVPGNFLLVPGVGFQGGSLAEVSRQGMNNDIGLLVNVSRAIIYAGNKENFGEEAGEIARQYQAEMATYLISQ